MPIVLGAYYIIPKRKLLIRNVILLIFSIGFYAYGEPKFVFIMVISILGNYIFGKIIYKYDKSKISLILGIVFNIGILGVFKYLNFIIRNINIILDFVGIDNISQTAIILPIGISFFTFQSISYLIDVYRKKVRVQNNILYLGLYISFFPQLIAGPIVRYIDIEDALTNRVETLNKFTLGAKRFIQGLSKKVILSNGFALIADKAFLDATTETTLAMAWLGAISYTLQIYFDFSGYSDMAIGLGKMFGFDFNENFNYPYISKSISEFWRRWHMSLGSWFRDYVYFPLGGSKVSSKQKLIRNLFVVWLLTGVWHGASWNFIIWGLIYFILISFEKLSDYPNKFKHKISKCFYQILTMIIVVLCWVIFRAEGLHNAIGYLSNMFGIGVMNIYDSQFVQYAMENKILLLVGITLSTPIIKIVSEKIENRNKTLKEVLELVICSFLLIVSLSYLSISSYNPFIYFNF